MMRRSTVFAAREFGMIAYCGYWAWALLASSDASIVLDKTVELPLLGGLGIPAGAFFIAAPLAGLALFLVSRSGGRRGFFSAAAFPTVFILDALRCLKLHDSALTYVATGLACAATALAAWQWLASRPFRDARASIGNVLAPAGIATAVGLEGAIIFLLVPWTLRGILPWSMESYPFSAELRRLMFADLTDLKPVPGAARKNLRGLRLEGADLSGSILKGADLRDARFFRARLHKVDLEGADLRGALLTEAKMSFINLRNADLSGAELSGMYSMGADLRGAVLHGARHHVQRFFFADCRGVDLTAAEMVSGQFHGADFRSAILRDANLTRAIFVRVNFDGADLSGATLANADFEQASLRGAILDRADLSGAVHLRPEALAEAASLRGAKLDPALLDEMKRRNPGLF
jgi:uncharacterized protein YjbI with pentapeptide repeats